MNINTVQQFDINPLSFKQNIILLLTIPFLYLPVPLLTLLFSYHKVQFILKTETTTSFLLLLVYYIVLYLVIVFLFKKKRMMSFNDYSSETNSCFIIHVNTIPFYFMYV